MEPYLFEFKINAKLKFFFSKVGKSWWSRSRDKNMYRQEGLAKRNINALYERPISYDQGYDFQK